MGDEEEMSTGSGCSDPSSSIRNHRMERRIPGQLGPRLAIETHRMRPR